MAVAATTKQLVVAARPRFEVDGQERGRLSEDLLRLEVTEDEEGMVRLEAVFLNWGRLTESSESGFVYFDGEVLRLGRTLVVRAGDVDNTDEIFRGSIMSIEGVYPEKRPPEIRIFAEDAAQWLRMQQHSRFFENVSDVGMADRIAADRGLQSDTHADGPSYAEFLQVNESDLAFLRERARAVDARLGIRNGSLIFRPRREGGDPPIKVTRENELLRFQVCAELAHQRAKIRVHGYSVANKEAIHESVGAEAIGGQTAEPGQTGPEVLDAIRPEAIEDLHLEAPATSDEARVLATSLMRRRARRFVCGHGITSGTPAMHVGARVDVVDVGPWFSGIYYIAQVRHTFDQTEGLRTHFLAERETLGGAA